jgi:hypothetical protein
LWRNVHPALRELSLLEFRQLRICCPYCRGSLSGCAWCNGTGLCCPHCTGLGFVGIPHQGTASERVPCPTCHLDMSDGPVFDKSKCMLAIDRWIDDWLNGRAIDYELTRRKEIEEIRKQNEANPKPRRGLWKHEQTPPAAAPAQVATGQGGEA